MKKNLCLLLTISFICACNIKDEKDNPPEPIPFDSITVEYLHQNIKKSHPRLVLSNEELITLKEKINSDAIVRHTYGLIKKKAHEIIKEDVIKRDMEGRRLLYTSRKFLDRVNALSAAWLIEGDSVYLNRLNSELISVSSFKDWNPEHFLDVAEILMGVSLAIDWNYSDLPDSTIKIAKKAIIEKGLIPGLDTTKDYNWWHNAHHNWNQVCYGGMLAGAIAIFDDKPVLAGEVFNLARKKIPIALQEYAPEGIYPEGASYWAYGTSYSVLTASMLESSLDTDFGISNYTGFMNSPVFVLKSIAPTGMFFNFSDCNDYAGTKPYYLLSWFAMKTGNKDFYDESVLLKKDATPPRYSLPCLLWISKFEEKTANSIPSNWKGEGKNPLAVFTSDENNYYFACKGGSASFNHANMDAGSFVFETDTIRWAIDLGNQNYTCLEKEGIDLWSKCQSCERWTLISKNNFGHSTLTVNNLLHRVEGISEIVDFEDSEKPHVSINLTPQFGNNLEKAIRKFSKPDNTSLIIEDEIIPNDSTYSVTWQMISAANAEIVDNVVILSEKGKKLKIKCNSHPEHKFTIQHLDPPPLKHDKKISGLKRIEIHLNKKDLNEKVNLVVELKDLGMMETKRMN